MKKELESLAALVATAENIPDLIYYADIKPTLKYNYLSPVVDRFLGEGKRLLHLQDPIGEFLKIVHPDDREIIQKKLDGTADYTKPIFIRIQNEKGYYMPFEEYVTPIFENSELVAVHGVYRSLEPTIVLKQELEYRATYDQLTDVYNRHYFEDCFVRYNKQENVAIALAICDLDGLKTINDQLGHKYGDDYIASGASLIKQAVLGNGMIARLGGDEFAILFVNIPEQKVKDCIASIQQLCDSYNVEQDYPISMSVGYAYTTNSISYMEQLYAKADAAMYQMKNERKKSMLFL